MSQKERNKKTATGYNFIFASRRRNSTTSKELSPINLSRISFFVPSQDVLKRKLVFLLITNQSILNEHFNRKKVAARCLDFFQCYEHQSSMDHRQKCSGKITKLERNTLKILARCSQKISTVIIHHPNVTTKHDKQSDRSRWTCV